MTIRSKDFGLNVSRGLLLASGLLAAGVGLASLLAPDVFYAVYGIEIGSNVNLTNELKASAGVWVITALLALQATVRTERVEPALGIAATVYLACGASRILSVALDGIPDFTLVLATFVELAIGAACLLRLSRIRRVATGVS